MFRKINFNDNCQWNIAQANLTEAEAKAELALSLLKQGRFSVAQAARLAEMNLLEFQQIMAKCKISMFSEDEFLRDLETIEALKLLRNNGSN